MSRELKNLTTSKLEICESCNRYILESGTDVQIELAKNRDKEEDFLLWCQSLVRGGIRSLFKGYGKKEINQCFADFLIRLEQYSNGKDLEFPREVNKLAASPLLMEYKTGFIRTPFFEVLGNSACGIKTERITHGFLKNSQKTSRREIDKGLAIIRTDGQYSA